jgi:transposase-like protein
MSVCKNLLGNSLDAVALEPVDLDLEKARCPSCKARGRLAYHSAYRRWFIHILDGVITRARIWVKRLKCTSCNRTHALLPEAAIPHSPFSVCFVASLITDWKDHRYRSIERLCEHYGIATTTFYRIRRRFSSCVKIAWGLVAGKDRESKAAHILSGGDVHAADGLLEAFFKKTNTSFCQPRPP